MGDGTRASDCCVATCREPGNAGEADQFSRSPGQPGHHVFREAETLDHVGAVLVGLQAGILQLREDIGLFRYEWVVQSALFAPTTLD